MKNKVCVRSAFKKQKKKGLSLLKKKEAFINAYKPM